MNHLSIDGPARAGGGIHVSSEEPIAKVLWRRRKIIAKAAAATVGLAMAYLVVTPSSYTSTAEIYVTPSAHRVINDTPSDADRSENYLNTQASVVGSAPVLTAALRQPGMDHLKFFKGASAPVDYLKKNLSVEVGKKVDLIDIAIETHNRNESATIANAVVAAYISVQGQTQHAASAQVLDILKKQKAQLEGDLSARQSEMAELRHKFGSVAFDDDKQNPLLQQENALSTALSDARVETVNAKASFEQTLTLLGNDPARVRMADEAEPGGSVVMDQNSQQADAIRLQIFTLQQALKDAKTKYLPDHPIIAQTQSRLDQLTLAFVHGEKARWEAAQNRQDALAESFNQEHALVLDQMTHSADFTKLDNEVNRIVKDLDVVDGRMKEVMLNQDAGSLNISVVEPAVAAEYASGPHKSRTLLGALIAGILSGAGYVMAREKMKERKPNQTILDEVDLPILGVMPPMDGIASATMRALQAHAEPDGQVAAATRGLSRAVAEQGLNDQHRTLLVASANPLEGRTTVACNLAITLARGGLRVLLVDANGNAPRLHRIFGVENQQGLYECLGGQLTPPQAVLGTTINNLDLLLCGNSHGGEIRFNNEIVSDVLGELAEHYDRVIVDAPADSRGREASILSANCDGTIMVLASRQHSMNCGAEAARHLASEGGRVFGVVLNDASAGAVSHRLTAGEAQQALPSENARPYKQLPVEVG